MKPDMQRIASDYRYAKSEAARLASQMNFVLLQEGTPKPRPVVLTTTKIKKRFQTWYAAWSWLYQVWQDRQPREIPMAILIE